MLFDPKFRKTLQIIFVIVALLLAISMTLVFAPIPG